MAWESRIALVQDLYFTQESIGNHFQAPYSHYTLDEAVEDVLAGDMKPSEFGPGFLRVVIRRNKLFCLDNRRLWVYKKAGVTSVEIKLVSECDLRPEAAERVNNFCSKTNSGVRSPEAMKSYMPSVRGRCKYQGRQVLKNLRVSRSLRGSDLDTLCPDFAGLRLAEMMGISLSDLL